MILVIKHGNVTLDGKSINMKKSESKKYPFSHGWIHFHYGGFIYYIRITLEESYVIRIDNHGKAIDGKIGELFIVGA